jgi:GNAT superfamily N-acetyltransferase
LWQVDVLANFLGSRLKMANWTIRRAENRDAEALSVCIDAAYGRYAARIADLPPVSADCAGEIAKFQVWVGEVAQELVGGLVLIPQDGFLRLANVAVHPDYRGAGLGRAFMALAEAQALEQGYRELRLTTHVDMPENVQLYAHLGWEQTGRDGNKVSMKKLL